MRGRVAADHVTFSGIPYAASPVGERRWAPPERPQPWRGVRDATAPASACAQHGYDDAGESIVVGQEDCLYLNVTVPRGAQSPGRRPVMVWLHGGGFDSGSSSQYGAAPLAIGGDVVVVTVNYRLGALGFLSSPALDGEGHPSGNYGLEDQAAALRWVRRNAARFGGDPDNVTLFGQSGGARSVCAHLASPRSRGLFHKAIMQSGPCATALVDKPVADERGAQATAELGCVPSDDDTASAGGAVTACLRSRPVASILDTLAEQGGALMGEYRDQPWMPVVGTPLLPRQPGEALADGAAAGMPLLVGTNRDEMSAFVGRSYDAAGRPLTEPAYRALVEDGFGRDAAAILARYPAADHPSPAVALTTLLTDWGGNVAGACSTLRTAELTARHSRVFAYELAEDSGLAPRGFPFGAFHGWELAFLWDLSAADFGYPPLTAEQQALSRQMVAYWTSFARTGDPNGPGSPRWAALSPGAGVVQSLAAGDGGIAPAPFAAENQCDFWLGQ